MKTFWLVFLLGLSEMFVNAQSVGSSNQPPLTFDLHEVSLRQALTMYADLKGRNLLQHPNLPEREFSLTANLQSKAEAATAFEKMFEQNGIATIPDGEKFVMIVPVALTNSVTPRSNDVIAASTQLIPAYSINLRGLPLSSALQIYSDYVGRKIVNLKDASSAPINFEQQTPLSKGQICYALETLFAWNGFRIVAIDDKTSRLEHISGNKAEPMTKP
jgi:hypothetical protein